MLANFHCEFVAMIKTRALYRGDFTLASGKKSSYYLDMRQLTLSRDGLRFIARMLGAALRGLSADAIGGVAIGADPIIGAALLTPEICEIASHSPGGELRGFLIRKEPKAHGKGGVICGPVVPGDRVVIIEDVVTTGESLRFAVEQARAAKLDVVLAVGLVDRMDSGEMFKPTDFSYDAIVTVADLGIDPKA